MRKIILQMMMTLDGFVAGPNGELDWVDNDPEMGQAHSEAAQNADALLMGHSVYQGMSAFWPEAAKDNNPNQQEAGFAKIMNEAPKIVLATKDDTLAWNNSVLLKVVDEPDLVEQIKKLKNEEGDYILFYGGIQSAQTLLTYGLVDELRLDVCPVALGIGKALFPVRVPLELISVKAYESGAAGMTYKLKQ
jgi:dihydrofolate reductase